MNSFNKQKFIFLLIYLRNFNATSIFKRPQAALKVQQQQSSVISRAHKTIYHSTMTVNFIFLIRSQRSSCRWHSLIILVDLIGWFIQSVSDRWFQTYPSNIACVNKPVTNAIPETEVLCIGNCFFYESESCFLKKQVKNRIGIFSFGIGCDY